eukprot:1196346-Prorocentrum_minimum.AAC.13
MAGGAKRQTTARRLSPAQRSARKYLKAYKAENTRKAYNTGTRRSLQYFLKQEKRGRRAFAASDGVRV